MPGLRENEEDSFKLRPHPKSDAVAPTSDSPESRGGAEDDALPLDDAARSEREYVRQRLREELGREPAESELDEWLRQHTEGY